MKSSKKTVQRLNALKGDQSYDKFSALTGVGSSTLFNYIKGRDIPLTTAAKIARATGCDLNWLAGLKENNDVDMNMVLKRNLDELKAIGEKLTALGFKDKFKAKTHIKGVRGV